jgi:polar amino acid transport system permease protein
MAPSGIDILFDGNNLTRILGGMLVAERIAIISLLIGLTLGILLGVLRRFRSPVLRGVLRVYLEVFRIIPLLVLLFVFYYILPEKTNMEINNQQVSIIVFSLWISAEMSEIVRSALSNIPKVQIESGKTIGLNRGQLYRYVLIPQAAPIIVPATINLVTRVIKTTSILLMIGVGEMIKVGTQVIENYAITVPTAALWVYGFIFILFFILCYPLSKIADYLEKKWAIQAHQEDR